MIKNISITFLVIMLMHIPLWSEEKVQNFSFEDHLKKVSSYLSSSKTDFKKELFKSSQKTLVESLFTLDTENISDFLKEGQDHTLTLTSDTSKYTAVILNPVIEEKEIFYPLFFADVRDIKNLKGLILYTLASGKIRKALIKRNMTPVFLIKLVDDSFFPDECEMKMEMTDIKKGGRKRSFAFRILAVRNVASIMEFISPKRELGKKILLKDKNLWIYSPKISRPVRLSTRQKFMGSSFSNNDLMDISLEDDYNITVEASEEINSAKCLRLLLMAKHNRVTYPKMVLWFNTKNLVTSRIHYYTPSGKILKKLEARKLKLLGGRERASELVMQNMFEKDSKTILEVKAMTVRKIPENVFSKSYLKR